MNLQQMIGIPLPVIQAPMAGVQDEALALAVAAAGGLGSMPCALLDPAQLDSVLQRFATLSVPVNLNFFCHAMADPDARREQRWRDALAPYYLELGVQAPEPNTAGARRPIDEQAVEVLSHYRPKVVSFHFGLPAPQLLQRIKSWGALVLASATTLEEGQWLERHGCDIVIAQGIQAGGHRGHFLTADLSLQRSTRDLVVDLCAQLGVPVVAAGGIGSRADVETMFDAGAVAIQAGTAYLLCPEATTSPVHRAMLCREDARTALTNLFSGRPARGLVNRLMRELGPLSELPPAFPWASRALVPLRSRAEAMGREDFTPLWSGTQPGRFRDMDAATVTRALAGQH